MKIRIALAIGVLALAACFLAVSSTAQMTSVGIDCSQINALHLLQQENMRAGLAHSTKVIPPLMEICPKNCDGHHIQSYAIYLL